MTKITQVDVIDVPEDIARQIMCKAHEWISAGKDYSLSEDKQLYAARCKHCNKVITNNKPKYDFKFKL